MADWNIAPLIADHFRALDQTVRSEGNRQTDLSRTVGFCPMSSAGTANYLPLHEFLHLSRTESER